MVISSAMRTMVPLLNSPASGDSGAGRRDCRDRPAPACWSGRTCPFAPVPRPGGPGGTVRRHRAPRAPGCGQVSQPGRSLTAHQVPIEEVKSALPPLLKLGAGEVLETVRIVNDVERLASV